MSESLLVIDKQTGPTSFDVVREVKKILPGAKVGHTGSLDPFASGVLVLLLGKATKLSNALLNADKSYHATMVLGSSTDSMDRTGRVDKTADVPELTADYIRKVLKSYEGEWLQTPPMFSAKKIHGVRLYELARQSISVRRAPIPVQLYRLDLISYESPVIQFEVHCSKGTYIRSLADDIGKKLGTVAHLAELRRLSCGAFTLEESITVEDLAKDPASHLTTGFQKYIQLLRTERVSRSRPLVGADPHLQMPYNSGNSMLN